MSKIKYATLVLPQVYPFPENFERFDFDEHTFYARQSPEQMIPESDKTFWHKSLGSFFWDDVTKNDPSLLVAWMHSSNSTALDHEHEQIQERLHYLLHTLLIVSPVQHSAQEAYLLAGSGEMQERTIAFRSVDSVSRIDLWPTPLFSLEPELPDWMHDGRFAEIEVMDLWKQLFLSVDDFRAGRPRGESLIVGMSALHRGFTEPELDFRIPHFVRAMESVLALKSNQGRWDFAKRALQFLPAGVRLPANIDSDFILNSLAEMYGVRSDCVHGKWLVGSDSKPLQTRFAEHTFVLEMMARLIFQRALLTQSLILHGTSRAQLEAAWRTEGAIRLAEHEGITKLWCRQPLIQL